ncbi:MAG TPA: hypothetical protein VF789_15430 [Thermoanaerobaculia bacterium]
MAPDSPRERLEKLAAQARERALGLKAELERRRGLPAGPGDLFVLPATAGLPVEWAVLERAADGKLLVVPADAGPPAGTADVEVPADAPGGPLSLRCRFGTWLDGALFEPGRRSGVLAPETVAEALRRFRQVESGTLAGSPLAEEVDAEPEYVDWIREVPERARELALAARPSNVRRFPSRSWGMPHKLAAAFALVSVGLSVWVGQLQRKVDRLSEPIFNPPSETVPLGEDTRGDISLAVPRTALHVQLVLSLDSSIDAQEGYLEIVDRFDKAVWQSDRVWLAPDHDYPLTLPRDRLPYGIYLVRVLPAAGFGSPPLAEERLLIEVAE